MICLTLEDDTKISIRPSAIRTVQAGDRNFTLVTLDDEEMYTVRESREEVIAMMDRRKGERRRG